MVIAKYDFPCPNNHGRYDLSMDELVALLDNAYNKGFEYGKEIATPSEVTATAVYENMDDNTKWMRYQIDE
jgi:hypothetical protein